MRNGKKIMEKKFVQTYIKKDSLNIENFLHSKMTRQNYDYKNLKNYKITKQNT